MRTETLQMLIDCEEVVAVNTELKIGDRRPIIRLLGISGLAGQDGGLWKGGSRIATIDGETQYRRVFIKRIGWEYYRGKDEDGELWEVELDNCDEEDYKWWLSMAVNGDFENK